MYIHLYVDLYTKLEFINVNMKFVYSFLFIPKLKFENYFLEFHRTVLEWSSPLNSTSLRSIIFRSRIHPGPLQSLPTISQRRLPNSKIHNQKIVHRLTSSFWKESYHRASKRITLNKIRSKSSGRRGGRLAAIVTRK